MKNETSNKMDLKDKDHIIQALLNLVDNEEAMGYRVEEVFHGDGSYYSVAELMDEFGYRPNEVRLSNEYTAIVYEDSVEIVASEDAAMSGAVFHSQMLKDLFKVAKEQGVELE